MTTAKIQPGSFCWFELATTDQDAARSFYSALFGWTADDQPAGPSGTYTMFRLGDRDAAAAYAMPPELRAQGIPPNWLVYVLVENADASADRAAALGAKVGIKPFDVMDHGRMALIEDPLGARFALWQPKQHLGATTPGDVGTISWADLQVRDQGKAGEFYAALFGWRMVAGKSMHPAKPGEYFHIMNGERMIGGIPPPDHVDPHAHPAWLLYVEVADCAVSTKTAISLGGRAYVDTMQVGENGRISVIADPQGAVFALHESQRA
jgi:uncharacterized protein